MKERGPALAIFVKTPALSPVKTRLQSVLGRIQAEEFYLRSVQATEALAQELKRRHSQLQTYWAVAEEAGLEATLWKSMPTLAQGPGGLGARLARVYDRLLKQHSYVFFLGADSPHLRCEELERALFEASAQPKNFLLGEAEDGGFYLFGGSLPLPPGIWTNIDYSTAKTAAQLRAALEPTAPVAFLNRNFDIDTSEDLQRYAHMDLSNLLPEQQALIQWSKQFTT